MATPSIHRIERLNYVIGGIGVIIGALTQPRTIALGLAVGIVLTCANFYVLRRLVAKWTAEAAAGRRPNGQLLLLPKLMALMALVAVSILFLPIDPFAFVIGYSIFILSIVIDTFYAAMRTEPTESPKQEESDHG